MIFVTVGTQLAFERMLAVVDAWAERSGEAVFAQVGPGQQRWKHLQSTAFLEPAEFDRYFGEATLVIAHAGMGSILSALSFGKPVIVMPRKAVLGEHRNDHQMATAKRFEGRAGVCVAWDETMLARLLDDREQVLHRGPEKISATAPDAFLTKLKSLIDA